MRIILISICTILLLTSCAKYTNEEFFTAIRNGDEKTVQAIINQRDMTQVRDGNAYQFDEATFKTTIVPIEKVSNKSTDENGFSGLWIAVEENKPEIVEILLHQKFDLQEQYVVDGITLTLRELVVENRCNPSLIKLFAQRGLDFNVVNNESPVILNAAYMGKWHCVDALIEAGADAKAVGISGDGLLTAAVLNPEKVDIDKLIQKMKDFDPLSKDANVAFIHAARSGKTNLVETFLAKGFNKCLNHRGKYLRDIAMENNHSETAALLPTMNECQHHSDTAHQAAS